MGTSGPAEVISSNCLAHSRTHNRRLRAACRPGGIESDIFFAELKSRSTPAERRCGRRRRLRRATRVLMSDTQRGVQPLGRPTNIFGTEHTNSRPGFSREKRGLSGILGGREGFTSTSSRWQEVIRSKWARQRRVIQAATPKGVASGARQKYHPRRRPSPRRATPSRRRARAGRPGLAARTAGQ